MAVAVIAALVACGGDGARDFRQPLHVGTALEEGSRHAVVRQRVQDLWRAFARTIVEGERQRLSIARAMPDRASEDARRTPADGPRHEGGSSAGSGYGGQSVHEALL